VYKGHIFDIELPHKKLAGKAVVDVQSVWLRLTRMSEYALVAKNSYADSVSGKDFGFVKHEAMNSLATGMMFKLPVTIQKFFGAKNDDGSDVLMDALQQKAQWLSKLVEKAQVNFEEAQAEFWMSKAAVASNQDIKKEVKRFDEANGGRPDTETLKRMTETEKVKVVKLDGSEVMATAAEMGGFYKVVAVVAGKVTLSTIIAPVFDASRQNPMQIARVRNFNVAFVELSQGRSK
jgi:hypothetical protein